MRSLRETCSMDSTRGGDMPKPRVWLIGLFVLALIMVHADIVMADPCLVVYPETPCVYHYDPSEYYTVGPGHPLYDPAYDRGGLVLLETGTDEVDPSIYQAPNLTGFVPSTEGNDGYVFNATEFMLYVDGFSNEPATYVNVLLVFDDIQPEYCTPEITVNGEAVSGFVYPLGDLDVTTPTPEGNNYSDVIELAIDWRGCYGLHIWAFSDENHNGVRDGGECFTAFSHDAVVPVEESTWGRIKDAIE